jgi:hypothetical protein
MVTEGDLKALRERIEELEGDVRDAEDLADEAEQAADLRVSKAEAAAREWEVRALEAESLAADEARRADAAEVQLAQLRAGLRPLLESALDHVRWVPGVTRWEHNPRTEVAEEALNAALRLVTP